MATGTRAWPTSCRYRGLRSTSSVSLDLEQALSKIQEELSLQEPAARDVNFRVIAEGAGRPLHPVLRDEVYGIGREALLNAFRHAHAKNIEIELRYSSRQLRMRVRDDGCGIDSRVLKNGGLSGMREKADRIGARLHLRTSSSAGTEIELSIPGKVAFDVRRKS